MTPEASRLPSAFDALDEMRAALTAGRLAMFLDYDGTLTPIVSRPELALLSDPMRRILADLALRAPVAVVSGRDLADVRRLVGLERIVYAGSHGFDIAGPDGLRLEQDGGLERLADLDAAESLLTDRLGAVDGARLDRKRFSLAVHYRQVAPGRVEAVERAVEEALAGHPRLKRKEGKKVFELQPDVVWDKGRAVLWILEALGLEGPGVLSAYLGDDVTDEDAFAAMGRRGVGILVGEKERPTAARYRLEDPAVVARFLANLIGTHENHEGG